MKIENKRILIVDDLRAMRDLIKSNLLAMGFKKLFFAGNGVEALSICRDMTVDLILTDWNMPKMDGLELLKNIRMIEKTKHVPVLMITAETNEDQVNQAIDNGVNDFIIKPFTPKKLQEKLDLLFAGKLPFLQSGLSKQTKSTTKSDSDQKKVDEIQAKILVVDDLPSNIDVIVGILKGSYKIRIATNGKKALEIAAIDPTPDLILLDIMMPEMDGMEVCRLLKGNPQTMDIPVIFLTAKGDSDTAVEGFKLGAVDYITKPVKPELLKARIKNHINLKKSKDSLKNQVYMLMDNARLREDTERISMHDIKNPLGVIIHQSALLAENSDIGKEYRKINKDVGTAGVTILNMVNASLNIYKMEKNNYQLDPEIVDIKETIIRVRDDLSYSILGTNEGIDHKIQINVADDTNVMVWGEELLCYSLLSNLLKNAVEASEHGEKILIEITGKDQVSVSIHNNAMIPQDIQNCFFEKYVTKGKKQGTGLGTYSAKLMTEAQKGSIEFTTSKKEGTKLIVKLLKWEEKV